MEIAASDTITERESSNLMEATEPMENSSAVASNLPTKRKDDEFDPAEETGDENEEICDENEEIDDENEEIYDENEEIYDENEEIDDEIDWRERSARYAEELNEYFRKQWIEPEWDVDSFDGLTYEASEYDTEFVDEHKELDLQEWLRFKTQLFEYKGFYVDPKLWPMYEYTDYRVFEFEDLERTASPGKTRREFFEEVACVCVERFNQKEKEDKNDEDDSINLEFVGVVGGVVKITNRPKSFITFKAREKPNGPVVEYQAKGWSLVLEDNNYYTHYPILCRPAPPKPSNWWN